ncbi:MAG: hypothetical protein PHW95_00940 [Patescibacteria group bacterium]|nr:hypothetical protein [Patescibacteria group bacterium]
MKRGFTIAELMVSISIVILITIISIPVFITYQKSSKLKSEARLMVSNLRLAQQLAVTEQKIYDFVIYPVTKKYQIINSTTGTVYKEASLDGEINISEISGLTNNTVQFNPTGGVAESGYIYLTNSLSTTSTIQIKPSGYIEIND